MLRTHVHNHGFETEMYSAYFDVRLKGEEICSIDLTQRGRSWSNSRNTVIQLRAPYRINSGERDQWISLGRIDMEGDSFPDAKEFSKKHWDKITAYIMEKKNQHEARLEGRRQAQQIRKEKTSIYSSIGTHLPKGFKIEDAYMNRMTTFGLHKEKPTRYGKSEALLSYDEDEKKFNLEINVDETGLTSERAISIIKALAQHKLI